MGSVKLHARLLAVALLVLGIDSDSESAAYRK